MTITEIQAVYTFAANCYVVASQEGNAFVVDPGAEADNIIRHLEDAKLTPKMILLTHGHFDHIGAVNELRKQYPNIRVYLNKNDIDLTVGDDSKASLNLLGIKDRSRYIIQTDGFLVQGEELTLDELTVRVLETPGHTKGSVCLLCGDTMFTGDTLFHHDCGRTDLYGGSFSQLRTSLEKISRLTGNYIIRPGHEEASTLEEERGYLANLLGSQS